MSKKPELNSNLLHQAYKEAVRVLQNCIHPLGIKASAKKKGYPQVWARDSMITLLGASLVPDKNIKRSLKSSFDILTKHQTSFGLIPNNVDTRTKKPNFQAYADGGLWFIIGAAAFFEKTKDLDFLKKNWPAIKKILVWCKYQDVDESGLISMQEAADWEDLFAVRGKGLYVNLLYYIALKKGSIIANRLGHERDKKFYVKKARKVLSCINENFWFSENNSILNFIKFTFGTEDSGIVNEKSDSLGRKRILPSKTILKKYSYYLPYLTFRDFGEWFDSFGNLLSILSGVADKKRADAILKFIEKFKLAKPYPIKSIYPAILPGQKDWRYYYKFGNLNLPHQYHNGGIWPFLGGFYVAALVRMGKFKKARQALLSLVKLNKKGREAPWEFNEWFHGKTARPMGMAEQAWSAGMYIYAYETLRAKKILFLE